MIQEDLKQVFVTYIKSTKEKLWDALTNPEIYDAGFDSQTLPVCLKVGKS